MSSLSKARRALVILLAACGTAVCTRIRTAARDDELALSLEDARELYAKDLNATSAEAFEFCQRALLRGQVVPGKSFGNLSELELRRWRHLSCTTQFCSSTASTPRGAARCQWTNYGKAIVALHDERVNEMCARRAQRHANDASLTFLTTIPRVPTASEVERTESHTIEVLLALGENARTPSIGKVRVLVDRCCATMPSGLAASLAGLPRNQHTDRTATIMLRQAIFECQRTHTDKLEVRATPQELEKVTARVFGSQPSYPDLFHYASAHLSGEVVALANADIVLRHVDRLSIRAFDHVPLVLVLSISPPSGPYAKQCGETSDVASRCDFWSTSYGLSWDAYIFRSPLLSSANYSFFDSPPGKLPIYMNMINAENCAGNFLVSSGYRLHNPCRTILAEHWHCMGRKTHFRSGRGSWAHECALRGADDGEGGVMRITKYLTLGHVGGPGTLC